MEENPKKKIEFKIDMNEIEKLMNQMIMEMPPGSFFGENGKPIRMGFLIKMNSKGESSINQFGNIKVEKGKLTVQKKQEPLVDVNYLDKKIIITAEMPGIEENEVKVSAFENRVLIDSTNRARPYFKKLMLRGEVKPNSFKHSFNNGILEIVLDKK